MDLTPEQHEVVRRFLLGEDEATIAAALSKKPRYIRHMLHGRVGKRNSIPFCLNIGNITMIEARYKESYPEQYAAICSERIRRRTHAGQATDSGGEPSCRQEGQLSQCAAAMPADDKSVSELANSPENSLTVAEGAIPLKEASQEVSAVELQAEPPLQVSTLSEHFSYPRIWLAQYRKVIRMRLTLLYVLVDLLVFTPIYLFGYRHERINYFSNIYALIPASIGVYGLWRIHSKRLWSIHRFYIGYAALCVSLLLWTGGSLLWSWYNFHEAQDVPYPWWPDLGYGGHQLLFPTVLLLMERSLYRERANLRRYLQSGAIFTIAVALWLLYLRGWHLTHSNDPWKFGLDLAYPVSDWICVHALWRMSNFSAAPKFRPAHAALRFATLGMLILLAADLCFSSTTTLPASHPYAYYVGSMSDFIFASGFYVLGCGLLSLPLNMRDYFPPSGPSERLRQLSKKLLSIVAPQPDESDLTV